MADLHVGVKELKTQLSKYLREVKRGRSIIITERGKPIGQIIPRAIPTEDRITMMIQAGLVEWNGKKLMPIKPIVKNRSTQLISDLLVDMRE